MKWMKHGHFSRIIIAGLLLTMTAWLLPTGLWTEKAEAAVQIDDPFVRETSQMTAGQKVTWDCVWFGSYPQSEVVCETDTERISQLLNRNYKIQYVTVSSTQWDKIKGAKYDRYGEATVDGIKYRRLSKNDALYASSGSYYYNWGSDTVRYFRYEPIKWRVLQVDGKDAFLMADKALDDQMYNIEDSTITWEESTVRSWLNGYDKSSNSYGRDYTRFNFINSAFTSSERGAIKTTDVVNDNNVTFGTTGGNNTSDKVFFLSENEVYHSNIVPKYGFTKNRDTYDEGRRCKSSTFAKAMGAYSETSSSYEGNCYWWLRSPGWATEMAAYVPYNGNVEYDGGSVDNNVRAVRPALHLDLSSSDLYSYAGTVCSDGSEEEQGGDVVTPDDPDKPDKQVITEDQLFGEYASYLDNKAYATICDGLVSDMDDVMGENHDGWITFRTALKWTGSVQAARVIKSYWGKDTTADEIAEKQALDLVYSAAGDSTLMQDVMDRVKSEYKWTSKTYSVVSKGYQYASDVKAVQELIASGYCYTKDSAWDLVKGMEDNWEEINKYFKAAGVTVNLAEITVQVAMTMEADHEVISILKENAGQGSWLYDGLDRIDRKMKNGGGEELVKQLIKKGVFEQMANKLAKEGIEFIPGMKYALMGAQVAAALVPVKDADEKVAAAVAQGNFAQMSTMRKYMIAKITQNHKNGGSISVKDLKYQYKVVFNAYLKSLENYKTYASKKGDSDARKKLNRDYSTAKKYLNYDRYIQSCLYNANKDWQYQKVDGKAKITGAKNRTSKTSTQMVKAGNAEDGYLLDIPESIDGLEVKNIGSAAFQGNQELRAVYVPGTVDTVEKQAFAKCTSLDHILLDNGVQSIGANAFAECTGLEAVSIPYSLKSIGDDAFAEISDLKIYAAKGSQGETYAKDHDNTTLENQDLELTRIRIDSKPDKSTFTMSEKLDTTGLKVTAAYEDGSEKDVTKDVYCDFTEKALGACKVEVSYQGQTAEYDVTITKDQCEYTVAYEDENSVAIAEPATGKAAAGETVTLQAPEIKGYTLDDQDMTRTIGAENEFVVTYSSTAKIPITDAEITYKTKQKYTGKQITPEVKVTYRGKTLKKGEDYEVKYNENKDPGKGSILVYGINRYGGDKELEFDIADGSVFEGKDMVRFAGDTRYETALKTADALKKSLKVNKFSDIIVADGNNYPDALAGSYLAKVKKAPLILVDRSVASEKMIGEYIEKNLSDKGTVYLLGGSDVVMERFEKSLKDTDVKRLAGDTRYETNLEILNEAKASKEDLLACTGEGFADSLSASAVGKPILLVDNRGLTKAQKTYLDKANVQDIYLIGGADVVSDKVGKELKSYDKDSKTERIAGDNRYKTSVAVAKAFFPDKCDTAVLAYGMKFPDGLAGGPLAISMESPLLLVEDTAYADAKAYGSSVGISRLAVLGGTDVISDATAKRILQ